MSDERLRTIEDHMKQLIDMVAENNRLAIDQGERMDGLDKRVGGLEKRVGGIENQMGELDNKFDTEKKINGLRHEEIIKEFRSMKFDIDYLRNESSKHDMEIHNIKSTIHS